LGQGERKSDFDYGPEETHTFAIGPQKNRSCSKSSMVEVEEGAGLTATKSELMKVPCGQENRPEKARFGAVANW